MQVHCYVIELYQDTYAMPELSWWARCDADGTTGLELLVYTALHASPVDALTEMTRLLNGAIETAAGQECPAQ